MIKYILESKPSGATLHFPLRLYILYPELKNLSVNFSELAPPETNFHLFHSNSGIVRVKKNGIIFSLLARNPDFMHITVGNITIRARMCSSFFAIAQFLPDAIEKIEENMARDLRNDNELRFMGWYVLHFWEKDVIKDVTACASVVIDTIADTVPVFSESEIFSINVNDN